ncbi:hypothetical protein Bca52824_005500 [Brassica carinata]|uniref:Protein ENHANCED DISEASE RESISTANCE 2 C-terminal domain-containing protein n=1 Tax=Brassica carinata TaxID=52824 RepID=A0A8X7WSE1_BRACI|nr:hypothetical protein Bca52824_005500 [Brassica carinata]
MSPSKQRHHRSSTGDTKSKPLRSASSSATPEWIAEAINGGSLRRVDPETGTDGWASPPGDVFSLRSDSYLTKNKIPAGDYLLSPREWTGSNRPRSSTTSSRKSSITRPISQVLHLRREPPDPGKDHHSAVFYFAAEEPIPSGSLLHRFINGDDSFRNQRFKIVNRIVKGPWVVKAAVGNYGACLLGKALTCNYHRGDNYFEIDVDICSSAIATAILRLALGYVTSVTIDMGFLAEAQTEEELPERLIGAVRVCQMEMSSAFVVDAPPPQQLASQPCRTLSLAKVNHDEDED